MNNEHQNSDRISELPQDTIEKILTLIPIRDALRTSVLSKKWRFCWASMPKLVFDEKLVSVYSENEQIDRYKLINAILHVLLLHKGPILEFIVCMADTNMFNESDQVILHLSRSNSIKKFIFEIWSPDPRYKLPSFFFSLHGLEHVDLTDCVFAPPLIFNGFTMLRKLRLYDVDITLKTLLRLLTNCPLLEEFTLIGEQTNLDFTGGNKCTFVELFKCLPSVRVFEMSQFYIEHFVASGMAHNVHLRILELDVCYLELSSVLCVINSSPNLEQIKVEMCGPDEAHKNFVDLEDYSRLKLDNLKELEITKCCISVPEMAFVKVVMAKSPILKIARMELSTSVSHDEEFQMFRDLLLLPFPRASPTAKFIIERPKNKIWM